MALLGAVTYVHADHGPGTSGSGFTTLTAETLRAGQFASSFQFDWTEFDDLSGSPEGVDMLDRSFLSTVSISYGLLDNFQLGLSIGYYSAEGAREFEGGDLVTADPDGLTDLWLTGKYRFYQGPSGKLSVIGGIKAPTGDSDVTNSEGERLEPSATAGTGAWDALLGVAYSLPISSRVNLDADALYTFRGERYDYRLGDRWDLGAAISWLVLGKDGHYPQLSIVGETTVRHISKSEADGKMDGNTGGTVLFLSPGLRVGFSKNMAASLGMQFPVVQNLNGEQLETRFRLITGISVAF